MDWRQWVWRCTSRGFKVVRANVTGYDIHDSPGRNKGCSLLLPAIKNKPILVVGDCWFGICKVPRSPDRK